jgi:hypothetical protein
MTPCCAIAYVVESNMAALIAKMVFSIDGAPGCRPPSFVPNWLILGVLDEEAD